MTSIQLKRELKKPIIGTIVKDAEGDYRQAFSVFNQNATDDLSVKSFIASFNDQNPQKLRDAAEHGQTTGRTEYIHVKVGYAQKFETEFKAKFAPK